MLLPLTSKVNEKGHLVLGGCDVTDLKAEYGTPLYVVDIDTIRSQCREYKKFFDFEEYKTEIIYASKVFSSKAVCQLMSEENMSMDSSTGGEIYTAIESGFPSGKIYFHGNNKSVSEIEYGLDNKIGCFVIDSIDEIKRLEDICRKRGISQDVMLRITPGIKASTHEYIQTGGIKSKFGFGLHNNTAVEAVERILEAGNLNLIGVHSHIGSQIFNVSCYEKLIDVQIKFVSDINSRFNIEVSQINIGGGLGIKYMPSDEPTSIERFAELVYGSLQKYTRRHGTMINKIYLEPGRSIIGNAGVTLYDVGTIKEVPGSKNYIAVDGGMSDNIRPMLYGSGYHAVIANRLDNDMKSSGRAETHYSIVGKHCESSDVVINDIKLPDIKVGDTIAVAATGAYCHSMASNYNGVTRSAVVAVEDGKSRIWVERQEYKDLISKDRDLYGK